MESKIAKAIRLAYNPVAVVLSDDKPESALQFKPGKWGCVMFMFADAAKGKGAALDAQTYGCWGGGAGLGVGNPTSSSRAESTASTGLSRPGTSIGKQAGKLEKTLPKLQGKSSRMRSWKANDFKRAGFGGSEACRSAPHDSSIQICPFQAAFRDGHSGREAGKRGFHG